MITTEVVEWTDPRVDALHTALFAEMGALYQPWLDELSPDAVAAARGSLAVDPTEVVVTLLVLDDDVPVATGAVRPSMRDPDREWDVKRVYVEPSHRGQGLSRQLMLDLASRAPDHGITSIVLETGGLQAPAHGLYESLGYERIAAYPPYGFFPGERFYGLRLRPRSR
jgi:GNAT superfamily N-acetyltransferase